MHLPDRILREDAWKNYLSTIIHSDCFFSIFFQLINAYISFARKAEKQTSTDIYFRLFILASVQSTISTMSFNAYASEKYGLLRNVRYTAQKLVVTDNVLGIRFAVLKNLSMK